MLPGLALHNTINSVSGDTVLGGELGERDSSGSMFGSDLANLFVGELGQVLSLTVRHPLRMKPIVVIITRSPVLRQMANRGNVEAISPTFADHVADVVSLRPSEKVFRIRANRVIATMKHHQAVRDRTNEQHVRNSVRPTRHATFSGCGNLAVAVNRGASPAPTIVRTSTLDYETEKSGFKIGGDYNIAHHRGPFLMVAPEDVCSIAPVFRAQKYTKLRLHA